MKPLLSTTALTATITVAAAILVLPATASQTTETAIKAEPGEHMPGGQATSRKSGRGKNAFSYPSGNLDFEKEFQFTLGNGIFRKLWVSSPASTTSSDGLGPLFNAKACQRCHIKDGRGHPPANAKDNFVSMLFRVGVPPSSPDETAAARAHKTNTFPDQVYGGQIQDFAIEGHPAEARPQVSYEEFSIDLNGGERVQLRRPTYTFSDLAFGALSPKTMVSPRIANQMIGLGLLEAIPDGAIRKHADPQDSNGDGISGRPNMVWDEEQKKVALGRFGWKAGQPSIRQQSAAAFLGDMGLSTTVFAHHNGDCTPTQARCRNAPNGASQENDQVEVAEAMLKLVTFYAGNLAVPSRPQANAPDVLAGKKLFHRAGCALCHVPRFETRTDGKIQPELRGQKIWPYTDMLLHDMGDGLSDGFTEGVANGSEWRTPPLWGIGHTSAVSGHTNFLHDGRARNILEAVLWHGGEAQAAKDHVVSMTSDERRLLLEFLNSL